MLIQYLGPKSKKVFTYNYKVYEFTPNCEVKDSEALKFLLSDDRKGLFKAIESESIISDFKIESEGQQNIKRGRGRPRKE